MRQKFGFVLIILLIIDLFVNLALQLLNNGNGITLFVYYAYLILAYVIIAILTWVEINNLEEFHLEKFTLITFVLSSIFRTRYRFVGESYLLAIIGISGLLVVLALFRNQAKVPGTKINWTIIGIVLGCLGGAILAFIEPFQFQTILWKSSFSNGIFVGTLRQAVNIFSFSAPIEEIVCRGFLWGYLRRLGWGDAKVFWVQGILFWFLHIYKIFSTPLTFFITIPILTIISTLLVLRSKQVFPAIISHALINILAPVLITFLPIAVK